ncbi:MAG TPA: FtsX-like permease family protein, partial [Thiotrichales bacterium]|nr:FtsX-like permease family protein [Thiotrichales bacterium]
LLLFLTEAALLSALGAAAGLLLGLAGSRLLAVLYPQVPFASPPWAVAAGLGVALFTGILFGTQPARRAARLDPVRALSGR